MSTYPIILYARPGRSLITSPWLIWGLITGVVIFCLALFLRMRFTTVLYILILDFSLCWLGWNQPFPCRPRPIKVKGKDQRGYAEFSQNSLFPDLLRHYFAKDQILIFHRVGEYMPDFAYVNLTKCILIDIEIDEPYTPRQHQAHNPAQPIHYIGADRRRDQFFQSQGWTVVRFSERQVLLYPHSCCKVLAEVIAEISQDRELLRQFRDVPDLQPEPRWTRQVALEMAAKQQRLLYARD